jgi:hypothetical protein
MEHYCLIGWLLLRLPSPEGVHGVGDGALDVVVEQQPKKRLIIRKRDG